MTIWYDYTTTLRNTGRSGIANVEWSIGQALRDARPDVGAFALAARRGLEVLDVDADLAPAVYARPDFVSPADGAVVGRSAAAQAALADAFGERVGAAVQLVSPAYRLAREGQARLRSVTTSRAPKRPLLSDRIAPGDVVVSMGADWGGDLARHLGALRDAMGCPVVTMVYDLIPLTHAHLAFHNDTRHFTDYYLGLLRTSDLITCISEQSRRDLLEFAQAHGEVAPPTTMLRLGEAPVTNSDTEPRAETPFFLWVGTIERRKNLELLYDALRILESEGAELPTVVIAGAAGWGVDDLLAELSLRSTRASRAIVRLGAVDEHTLDRLYRRAAALLFPSQFEGWGLPVREASIRGCPVAAGDSPAVREAAEGLSSVTLLPTDDPGPWADYLCTPPTRCEPAERHPWSATADRLVTLLDELLPGPSSA